MTMHLQVLFSAQRFLAIGDTDLFLKIDKTLKAQFVEAHSAVDKHKLHPKRQRPTPNLWRNWVLVTMSCLVIISLVGCGFSRAQTPADEGYRPVRSPYPTFTPTPFTLTSVEEQPISDNPAVSNDQPENVPLATLPTTEEPETESPDLEEPTAAPTVASVLTEAPTLAPPRLVVSSPLVNVRAGPGTEYPILTTIERGEEFDIVGRNDASSWWRFCCINNEPAWIIDELVETDGAIDGVPVSDAVAQVPPTATSPPAAVAPPPTPVPAEPTATSAPPPPTFSFELQNVEQFPENKLVRVFLYVFDSEQALDGYSLRVTKDGGELPVNVTSVGGQPSLTWPIADSRQRFQNMKVEFSGVSPAGTWVIQLIDGGGAAVGPPATFALGGNEPNQELYVRYRKQ